MNRNHTICPYCGIGLYIPPEIAHENIIQCLNCYNSFPNPLKKSHLLLKNPGNPNLAQFFICNDYVCPNCGDSLEIPLEMQNKKYIECPACYATVPNPRRSGKRTMSGYNTTGKYLEFWTSNLDLIESKIKHAKKTQEEQIIELNISDLEKLGGRKKSGYTFTLEYQEGSIDNISDSAVARDLAIVLEKSKKFKTLSKYWFKLNLLNTGKMLITDFTNNLEQPSFSPTKTDNQSNEQIYNNHLSDFKPQTPIYLPEAIEKILKKEGKPMSIRKITNEILKENRYCNFGQPITESRIESAAKNYGEKYFYRFDKNIVSLLTEEEKKVIVEKNRIKDEETAKENQRISRSVNRSMFWEDHGNKIIGSIIGIVIVVLFIIFSGGEGSSSSSSKVQNSPYDASVHQVKSYLKKTLKDPSSYEKIEWGPVVESSGNEGYKYVVRHKYRAKNSYGGYVVEHQIFYLDSQGNVLWFENVY